MPISWREDGTSERTELHQGEVGEPFVVYITSLVGPHAALQMGDKTVRNIRPRTRDRSVQRSAQHGLSERAVG